MTPVAQPQADGLSVLWLSADAEVLTIWNFVARKWAGSCTTLHDVTAGAVAPPSYNKGAEAKVQHAYALLSHHTYQCICTARQCQMDARLKL